MTGRPLFVCPLGIAPYDLRTILRSLQEVGETRNPFEHVLISPLFCRRPTLELVREMRERGIIKRLYFDSGGYQVQKGVIGYWTLYHRLLDAYKTYSFADVYVMPDCPPVSTDSPDTVQHKVRLTVEGSIQFYREAPHWIRDKALFVVQGKDFNELEYVMREYLSVGARYLGFGSFATRGRSDSVNYLTNEAITNLNFLLRRYRGVSLHCFGVGNPATAYVLSRLGVRSFDSSGWIKAAAYGNIYFPFTRAYNVSFRRIERGYTAIDEVTFRLLKDLTEHACAFCEDYWSMSRSRNLRLIHNLLAMVDTVQRIEDEQVAAELINRWAPMYSRLIGVAEG